MTIKTYPVVAFLSLLSGGVSIGFAGILMRVSDVSPVASAFWRMALAVPLLWVWAFTTQTQDKASGKRTGIDKVVLLAGLCFACDLGVWHLSLHYTTVANATLLANLAPVLIALWMWLVHRTRFARIFLIGMFIALVGAIMLIGPNAVIGGDKLLGDGLGLGTAVFYATYLLVVKNARDTYSTARLMAWSSTITALALLPFALTMTGAFWPATVPGWLPLLGLAIICQIGGQSVIAYALAHLPATLSSVSLLIQPLTATIAAWIIFQEVMSPIQILGGLALILGIYLSKRGS
jgi:drug/metabolite transporter (DMT)-like permease